jgi:transposase
MATQEPTTRPDPEVSAKAPRRKFKAEYKRRIIAAVERLEAEGGSVGALLRKEGLYSSQLSVWRKAQAAHGDAGLAAQKPGRKPGEAGSAQKLELRKRDRRIATLERKLAQANFIIDIQKKVAEMMALTEPNDDESAS